MRLNSALPFWVCLLLCVGASEANDLPIIVQFQEWFAAYSTITEGTMQLKRAANSNVTLAFNIELLEMLATATIEMRQVDNATVSTIEQADTIGGPCRQLVLQLFRVYRTIGQAELQACAAYATTELRYWTTQRFFSYANILHREITEHTHRVLLILERYNKVTQVADVGASLDEEYYRFNNYNNALQEVLNDQLERFKASNHPLKEGLLDCLDTTVTLHQLDMEYVLSYIDNACGLGPGLI